MLVSVCEVYYTVTLIQMTNLKMIYYGIKKFIKL